MIYGLLMINILLMVIGQMLWKTGVRSMDNSFSIHGVLKVFLTPHVIGGLILFAGATIVWLYILSREELSKVYPIQSLSYVVTAILSMIFFKEYIPLSRWCGILLIVFGAYLVSIN